MARARLIPLLLGVLLALPAAAQATTFTVNSSGDPGDPSPADTICDVDPGEPAVCTLRAAINATNASSGPDTIEFDFPTQPQTIGLTADLPATTGLVTIDGY